MEISSFRIRFETYKNLILKSLATAEFCYATNSLRSPGLNDTSITYKIFRKLLKIMYFIHS